MGPARRDAVITGLGAVCAVAPDSESLWDAVASGRNGIGPIRRFPVESFRARNGAIVESCADPSAAEALGSDGLCRRFAVEAATEAIRDAGLDRLRVARDRIGFVFGTGLGGSRQAIDVLAGGVADDLDLRGPRIVVSTACSSSTCALGLARDLLAMGAADYVVAGGADVLSAEVFAGFHALGVLSPAKCAPFSHPFGTTLGEGAGFVVLEREEVAARRGASRRAVFSGYGLSGDAFHETSPDPTGAGVERALRGALRDARLAEDSIGYVNAHGSGTEANDPAECRGIRRGLGAHARRIPISSTKGTIGHAQGAAGVLEAIVTILAMEHGVAPSTQNFAGPRPHAPEDPVGGPCPRAWPYEHALCLNAAFGGANAAVVLSRSPRASSVANPRPLAIFGVGLVGPWGCGIEAFEPWREHDPPASRRVPPFDLRPFLPRADPRGLDPMSRFLLTAAALALGDAGVEPHGEVRDRTGLFVGATTPSPESVSAFHRSIRDRGLSGLSASAFARIVLNAPGGFCSKLLSLRGPHATITTGNGSGLAAVVLAAEYMSARDDVDWIVAGGVHEAPNESIEGMGDRSGAALEGASCLVIGDGRAPAGDGRAPAIRIAGWGVAGPGRSADAVERARAAARGGENGARVTPAAEGLFAASDDGRNGRNDRDDEGAVRSAAACARAVLALRRGSAERALVVSDSDHGSSIAVLLTR
ncbi:MAG TPA: beta-ketoacyl-[acyl-carrier-protein] synthase family protein [Acidobacteriota bacterium]|nr:beta-ketoacyl-[acyl-carrier-protein] synthase family protein [Acidobacteriota bacterium]